MECLYCGKDTYDRRKYCSAKCGYEYRTSKKSWKRLKECVICGEQFFPRNPKQRCCSSKCSHIKGGKTVWLPKTHFVCLYCGKLFEHRRGKDKDCLLYCSRDCAFRDTKVKIVDYRDVRSTQRCENCGEVIKYNYRFCNRPECQKAGKRKWWNEKKEENLKWQRERYRKQEGLELLTRECLVCGEPFKTWYQSKECCSPKCGKRRGKQQRRAREYNQFVEIVDLRKVFFRDKGRCQICGKRLNLKRTSPHPLSAVRDHIVPLSKGGEHSYKNIQLACFICNSRKGERRLEGGEQLRIF